MKVKHRTIHAEEGQYCGWPANHGAWQWGAEMLFGFIQGDYGRSSMHNVVGTLRKRLARSLDWGRTWKIEDPDRDFECMWYEKATLPFDLELGKLDSPILRVCGIYDHGGDDCLPHGGFYLSYDRGRSWHGAYPFVGVEEDWGNDFINTSRTRVLGNLVFCSRRHFRHWGTDEVVVLRFGNSSKKFSMVGGVDDGRGRVVMPAVVLAKNGSMVMAARRRAGYRSECWIQAYHSKPDSFLGRRWEPVPGAEVLAHTGGHNGNPPALVTLDDGRIVCAWAQRSMRGMFYRVSEDNGLTWGHPVPFAYSPSSDIGYPQLFQGEAPGTFVCVYYWSSPEHPHQHLASAEVTP